MKFDDLFAAVAAGVGVLGAFILLAALISALTAFPVMVLWNAVMAAKFGLPVLTFLDALYLSLLCSLLFKNTSSSSSSKN